MKTPTLEQRIDAAVEAGLAPDEYFSVWEEAGRWQLDALKHVGCKPHHKVLDVGCGAMRFGMYAVDYLDDGNYYGIDAFAPYISAARRLAAQAELTKRYELLVSDRFEFHRFGVKFDFAMAQSVVTHLSGEECDRCVAELKKVMKPGGTFLFSYLVGVPHIQGLLYGALQPMRRFAEPDPRFFEKLAAQHGVRFEPLSLPHLTGQQVALYRFD